MKMNPESQLLKGNTPTLTLAVLREGPSHGYAIVQEINRRSGNSLALRQATLYPALHALERDGLIESDWVLEGSDRPRRVYKITPAGVEELDRRLQAWRLFSRAIESVVQGGQEFEPS